MKMMSRFIVLLVILAFAGCAGSPKASTVSRPKPAPIRPPVVAKTLSIIQPAKGAAVKGAVKVCMQVTGVTVESADRGVNKNRGHLHLLIDDTVPSNLTQPIAKDANHIHLGDGSTCTTLDLCRGAHSITALFASGDHVPSKPLLTDSIHIYQRDDSGTCQPKKGMEKS